MGGFSSDLLVLFGLISMVVAAVFNPGPSRLSSACWPIPAWNTWASFPRRRHRGAAAFGALPARRQPLVDQGDAVLGGRQHPWPFTAPKSTTRVRGVLRTLPATGVLWLAGFLAIVGSPPFGPFLSELTILKGMFDAGRPLVALAYLSAFVRRVCRHGDHFPPHGLRAAARLAGGDGAPQGLTAARASRLWSTHRAGNGAGTGGFAAGSVRAASTHRSAEARGRRVGRQLMSMPRCLIVHNGHAFSLADCPRLPIEDFRREGH